MFAKIHTKDTQAISLLSGAVYALFLLIFLSQSGTTIPLANTASEQVAQVVSGTNLTVSNDVELLAAIKMAKGGETVLIKPGTYTVLKVQGMNYTSPVTFKSADVNNRANFKSFAVLLSSNVTIDSINFTYAYDSALASYKRASEVNSSKNVIVKNSSFIGANGPDGYGVYQAIAIRWGDGVVIDNNSIKTWDIAIVAGESMNITLSKNDISAMAGDGIESAGNQQISVIGNYIHGFRRNPTSDMHPDSIQFWTNGTKVPSKNIVIKDNIIDQTGSSWTQSIFMRNEAVDSKQIVDGKVSGYEMYYDNVLIENNKITNYHLHGITLGEAKNVIIRNNTLTAADRTNVDEVTRKYLLVYNANNGIYVPMIRPNGSSTNVRVENNSFVGGASYTAERIANYTGQAGWIVTGNTINGVPIVVKTPTTPTTPTQPTNQIPTTPTSTATVVPYGWRKIAVENQAFTITGTQVVRYGAEPNWVEKMVTATGTCSSTFFARDPAYKTVKMCIVKEPTVYVQGPQVPQVPQVPVVKVRTLNTNNQVRKDKVRTQTLAVKSQTTNLISFASMPEAQVKEEPAFTYPLGLFAFTAEVTPGATETVTITLEEKYDTTGWTYRKFNSAQKMYADITNLVTYSVVNNKTVVTYDVKDNGPLDMDVRLGYINDPAGPSLPVVVVPPAQATTTTPVTATTTTTTNTNNNNSSKNGNGSHSSGGGASNHGTQSGSQTTTSSNLSTINANVSFDQTATNNTAAVLALTKFLNQYEQTHLTEDITLDASDVAAVKAFQLKYKKEILDVWGLTEATGYVGITTRLKMNYLIKGATASCPAFTEYNGGKSGISQSTEIGRTQSILTELGMYTGPITNMWDGATNQALIKFQETFHEVMLDPWQITVGTGYKYKTTNKFLNYFAGCDTGAVQLEGVGEYKGI